MLYLEQKKPLNIKHFVVKWLLHSSKIKSLILGARNHPKCALFPAHSYTSKIIFRHGWGDFARGVITFLQTLISFYKIMKCAFMKLKMLCSITHSHINRQFLLTPSLPLSGLLFYFIFFLASSNFPLSGLYYTT